MKNVFINPSRPDSHFFHMTRTYRAEAEVLRAMIRSSITSCSKTGADDVSRGANQLRHATLDVWSAAAAEGLTCLPRLITGTAAHHFSDLQLRGPEILRPSLQSLGLLGLATAAIGAATTTAVGVVTLMCGSGLGALVGLCTPSRKACDAAHRGAQMGAAVAIVAGALVFSSLEVVRTLLRDAAELAALAAVRPLETLTSAVLDLHESVARAYGEAEALPVLRRA